jgi:hypothetical protein
MLRAGGGEASGFEGAAGGVGGVEAEARVGFEKRAEKRDWMEVIGGFVVRLVRSAQPVVEAAFERVE